MQWWMRKAKLGSNRIQACKAGSSSARSSTGTRSSTASNRSSKSRPSSIKIQQQTATAMMHAFQVEQLARGKAQLAACPSIHEHRPWAPQAMQEEVILPNPGYRVAANLWNLDIMERAHTLGPMASFLRHVSTMQSPDFPSYASALNQQKTFVFFDIENLAELQRYLEKLQSPDFPSYASGPSTSRRHSCSSIGSNT